MKSLKTTFTKRNSLKLFAGVFVSVVAMFAMVYLVQNPVFRTDPEASGTYTYTLYMKPTVSTSGCNTKIYKYTLYTQWKNSVSPYQILGSTTYSFLRKSPPSQFTTRLPSTFKGMAFGIQTVSAYDSAGKKIGNSKSLGSTGNVSYNGSRTRSVTIPCSGF